MILAGCQLTDTEIEEQNDNNKRATLIDLARAQPEVKLDKMAYTKAQRAEKLTKIYQSILTLEPDPEIRTQVEYRLVQMDSQAYENLDFESLNQQQMDQALTELVNKYQGLLTRYPNRDDNELIQYQLAKTLDLQGKLDESLLVMESLLAKYPDSQYLAELNFRRGEIYYNLANYSSSLSAYQEVIKAKDNEKYLLNSIYMSGWALFKLDQLAQADIQFIQVLEAVISKEKQHFYADNFNFDQLSGAQLNLAHDAQRVLNISLSQQNQSTSLVTLLKDHKTDNLYLYQHILFKNLADFLVEKDLKRDAELTYLAYIDLVNKNGSKSELESEYLPIWATRFSLDLLELYKKQGKYSAIRALKQRYVLDYGLESDFFKAASTKHQDEVLPYLLKYSYQHARALYAKAQKINAPVAKKAAFTQTALWLKRYLDIANYPRSQSLLSSITKSLLSDEFLYADASFESGKYQQALKSYHQIAYKKPASKPNDDNENGNETKHKKLRLEAAYATTLTIRTILSQEKHKQGKKPSVEENQHYQTLLTKRFTLDKLFISTYPKDYRALALATFGAEYAFKTLDYMTVNNYSDFVLKHYKADAQSIKNLKVVPKLSNKSLKQVQIVSQLQANILYKQKIYQKAELAYVLALRYVNKQAKVRREMRELLASCIYFQGQNFQNKFVLAKQALTKLESAESTELASSKLELIKKTSAKRVEIDALAEQAIQHYLRIFVGVNNSKYALTGQFDAANLLLEQALWRRAIDTLLLFKKRYPKHKYTAAIPAKLAKSYEKLEEWQLAAEQLLVMANAPEAVKSSKSAQANSDSISPELRREAQYTAAQYYIKAGNHPKAINAYRTYAHKYPKPFDIAQEVRFKLSQLYKISKQRNKEYFWYRKVISFHDVQARQNDNRVTKPMLPRSTYLSSVSALGLGKAHQQSFKWAKLKIPLNKSLKTKQKSMKAAIGYYQKVLAYQLAEFVPNATFNLAQMYRQLAADVMSSQRPKDLDELALEEYEILLEEIAYPFEEKSIEIHASNAERTWQNIYDKWVEKSFRALAELDPVQFDKQERVQDAVSSIH